MFYCKNSFLNCIINYLIVWWAYSINSSRDFFKRVAAVCVHCRICFCGTGSRLEAQSAQLSRL